MKKILSAPVNGGHEFYLLDHGGRLLLIHVHRHNISYDKFLDFFAYEEYRTKLLAAIETHRRGLEIIVCFMYATMLKLDGYLFDDDDFKPDARKVVTKHIEDYHLQILADSRKVLRTAEAQQLIRVFRYSDAKTHCELYDLDFDSILEPIRNNLLVG